MNSKDAEAPLNLALTNPWLLEESNCSDLYTLPERSIWL